MELTELEQDILGDMAEDSHGVGELVGFIRSRDPKAANEVIFARLRALLADWITRGWLQLGPAHRPRANLTSIDQLLPWLDSHGPLVVGIDSDVELPELDLTDQAFADVPWLRGAV
jgi:hypothetical protein